MLPKCGFVEHILILNVSKVFSKHLFENNCVQVGSLWGTGRETSLQEGHTRWCPLKSSQLRGWELREWAALQQSFPTPLGPQTIWGWWPVTPSKQALWRQKPFLPRRWEVLGKVMTGIIFKNLGRFPHSSKSPTYHLHLVSITCWAWISWESISQAPSRGQYTC